MNFSIIAASLENGKASHNPLLTCGVREKISQIETAGHRLLLGDLFEVPLIPGRDVEILPIKALPAKKGIGSKEGQARLLHDLASIELQAMELAFRSLCEFPNSPKDFREELNQIAYEESQHLKDCLDALEELGYPWGTWPTHTALWTATHAEDSLLDRIVIVHRYLEGSGLDAGENLLRRLRGMGPGPTLSVVERIHREEIAHVSFGSRWYREICKQEGFDPDLDFGSRLSSLFHRIPRRLEPIQDSVRLQAEFSLTEIEVLKKFRERWLNASNEPRIHT